MARVLDDAKKRVKKLKKGPKPKTSHNGRKVLLFLVVAAAGVGYLVSRVTRKDDNLESVATEVPEHADKV